MVGNNVGLYTVNSQGTGAAVVTFPDYSYVTPSNAGYPGETVILWANGLGPIPTNDAQLPDSSDLTNVPLEILIGGKTAAILYRGRNSCCASLDQINVTIPNGIGGCVTPIVLEIGALVRTRIIRRSSQRARQPSARLRCCVRPSWGRGQETPLQQPPLQMQAPLFSISTRPRI